MGFSSSSRVLLAVSLFLAECRGLCIPSVSESCTTDACQPAGRSVDSPSIRDSVRPESVMILSRSLKLDMSKTIVIVAAVVGGLALCGILAIVLWYQRGNAAFLSKKNAEGFVEFDSDKASAPPPSARYIAPPPRVFAERWASLVTSTSLPIVQPSAAKGPRNLVITVPSDEPPPSRSWKLKRVPVPRLSRLPSANPRASLARIRGALRAPRRQDGPRPKAAPAPLPIIPKQDVSDRASPIASGIPSALLSAAPLTSRLTTLMNRIQSEYNV
ncbi:hypothetical protein C8R44DRAFT_128301 [Mycena epipterygia]|nr:hypothetical protein C8R44DRAFT_128301 [Mycena epipterygia]